MQLSGPGHFSDKLGEYIALWGEQQGSNV